MVFQGHQFEVITCIQLNAIERHSKIKYSVLKKIPATSCNGIPPSSKNIDTLSIFTLAWRQKKSNAFVSNHVVVSVMCHMKQVN